MEKMSRSSRTSFTGDLQVNSGLDENYYAHEKLFSTIYRMLFIHGIKNMGKRYGPCKENVDGGPSSLWRSGLNDRKIDSFSTQSIIID